MEHVSKWFGKPNDHHPWLARKQRFAQGKTYYTTVRSQSLEYIGDKVTKHQNVCKHFKQCLTNLLLSFRETRGVMLLRIFTLLLFKAPNFPLLSKLDPKLAKKNNTHTHTQIGCILQLWWAGWLKRLGL